MLAQISKLQEKNLKYKKLKADYKNLTERLHSTSIKECENTGNLNQNESEEEKGLDYA